MLASAAVAGSVALAGFGIDSLIEIFASVIVVWQLKGVDDDREQRTMRYIGLAFFGLSIYILVQSAYILASGSPPKSRFPASSGSPSPCSRCASLPPATDVPARN